MTGRVISVKLQKTATVLVERIATHPLYKKTFTRTKKYLVDDLVGVKTGDIVEIIQCKPISKNKHWRVVKVLGRSLAEIAEEQMKEKAQEVIAEVMPEANEKLEENKQKEAVASQKVVMDNSTVKLKSKKKGRTELSK